MPLHKPPAKASYIKNIYACFFLYAPNSTRRNSAAGKDRLRRTHKRNAPQNFVRVFRCVLSYKKRKRFLFFKVGFSAVVARAAILPFRISVVKALLKAAFFPVKRLSFAAESAFIMRAPAKFFAGLKSALPFLALICVGVCIVGAVIIKIAPFKAETSLFAVKSTAKTGYALLARAAYFHAHWPAT